MAENKEDEGLNKSKKTSTQGNNSAREDLDNFTVMQDTEDTHDEDLSARDMSADPHMGGTENAASMGALGSAQSDELQARGINAQVDTSQLERRVETAQTQTDNNAPLGNTPDIGQSAQPLAAQGVGAENETDQSSAAETSVPFNQTLQGVDNLGAIEASGTNSENDYTNDAQSVELDRGLAHENDTFETLESVEDNLVPNSDPDSNSESESDSNIDPDPDSETGSDPEAGDDSETGSDAEIDGDSETVDDSETGDGSGSDPDPEAVPLEINLQVRVSNATDDQAIINSEDGYDLQVFDFGESVIVTGAQLDIAGVADDARIEYVFADKNTVEATLLSPWDSVKNIEITSEQAGEVTLNNFVHTDVSLGDGGDSTIIINDAKRGNIETGDGHDTIDINSFTNNASWSNTINVESGAGADAIALTGDKGITQFNIDAGVDNDQVTIDGEYYDAQVSLGG